MLVKHFWMNQCLKWFSVEIDRRTLTIWIVCRNSKEFTLINIVRSDIESSSLFKNIIFLIVIYTIVIVNVFICELYWIIIISVRFTIIVIFIASNKKFRLGWVKWSQNEVPLWWVVVTLTLSPAASHSTSLTLLAIYQCRCTCTCHALVLLWHPSVPYFGFRSAIHSKAFNPQGHYSGNCYRNALWR